MGTSADEVIVKANKLVQAKMPLSKLEHRIVALLISQLSKNDEEFEHQKLRINDLKAEADSPTSGDLYRRATDICDSLLEKKISIKETDEDGRRRYRGVNLMNECTYREGDGYIEAKFNDAMKEFLLQLKRRFTMYDKGHYVPLNSTYSMRVYELLKMREKVNILRMTVEEFREILGVEEKYGRFSQLKYHVIKKSQEEIREKTDISFTFNVEREGKSPKRIKFFIESGEAQGGEKPKMEDRTEAPNIDVIDLFLNELSQEEIDELDNEKLKSLHEEALQQAQRREPDASKTRLQSETYRIMLTLWRSRKE